MENVSSIKWGLVAILPEPTKTEVVKELTGLGYTLIHSPFGSYYVNKDSRMHPAFDFTADKEEQILKDRAIATLKTDISSFIVANVISQEKGAVLINSLFTLFPWGDAGHKQSAIIRYFIQEYSQYHTSDAPTYSAFRTFCKLSCIEVDNQNLQDFMPFHADWWENERKSNAAKIATISVESALESGDKNLAIQILMQTNRMYREQATAAVENMIKLRELQNRAKK
jgi:hypothetical protein